MLVKYDMQDQEGILVVAARTCAHKGNISSMVGGSKDFASYSEIDDLSLPLFVHSK